VTAALPILYSFRRCPYAMRARMALAVSAQAVEHREILLRDKPAAMLTASPKGTVPVLILPSGQVLDESLDIMLWALNRSDPQSWLQPEEGDMSDMRALIAQCDGPFKQALDAYKYARTPEAQEPPRALATDFMVQLEIRLNANAFLFGTRLALADAAVMPFVRQFAAVQPGWFSEQPWPRLQGWLVRMTRSAWFEDSMQKREVWVEVA
jgi:glutathione S-transferase